ncbi:hypothetical protein SAMN05216311_103132 [Chitinophaga sp. CF418]|nr:hypothetical protein SAMN05216311_103132 [Chitinophaga sp. CF418]
MRYEMHILTIIYQPHHALFSEKVSPYIEYHWNAGTRFFKLDSRSGIEPA